MNKILIISIFTTCVLINAPEAQALDWGLGSKITNGIKNIFIGPKKDPKSQSEYYKKKEKESISKFLDDARRSGYVTNTGSIDYNRINNDPVMLSRLNKIMSVIEPAAGPEIQGQPTISLKPAKLGGSKELRSIK